MFKIVINHFHFLLVIKRGWKFQTFKTRMIRKRFNVFRQKFLIERVEKLANFPFLNFMFLSSLNFLQQLLIFFIFQSLKLKSTHELVSLTQHECSSLRSQVNVLESLLSGSVFDDFLKIGLEYCNCRTYFFHDEENFSIVRCNLD